MRLEWVVINLDRRADRYRAFVSKPFTEKIRRVAAIDGSTLQLTPQLRYLLEHNSFGYAAGIVGCALSHLAVWKELAASDTLEGMVIMEDDFDPGRSAEKEIPAALSEWHKVEGDLLFMNYHPQPEFRFEHECVLLHALDSEAAKTISFGGTACYALSKTGARKLLEIMEEVGMCNPLDVMMQLSADFGVVVHYSTRVLGVTPVAATVANSVDSDVQTDRKPISGVEVTIAELVEAEHKHLAKLGFRNEKDYDIGPAPLHALEHQPTSHYTYRLGPMRVRIYGRISPIQTDDLKRTRPATRL